MAQVFESLRGIVLNHEPSFVSAKMLQRHADLGDARLIEGVLGKLKERELLAFAFQNLCQSLTVYFKPVLHVLLFHGCGYGVVR